jgi:hypothetical protein
LTIGTERQPLSKEHPMSIEHKSTAKATIRDLITAYGRAGFLSLVGEVAMETVERRRGRPTRDEKVARLVAKAVTEAIPAVAEAEQAALDAAAAAE